MSTSGLAAPQDYEEMFKEYYGYVCQLVCKFGIEEQSKEDVASSILLRFYERDFLAKFDPSLEFEYQQVKRPARFKTFLSGFVELYVRHHRDNQGKRASRYPLQCDMRLSSGDTWLEVHGPSDDSDYTFAESKLIGTAVLQAVRGRLSEDQEQLEFFEEAVREFSETGQLRVTRLQQRLGASQRVVARRMAALRELVAEVMDEHELRVAGF